MDLSRHVSSVLAHFTSSREGFKRLINQLPDRILAVLPAGTILFANPPCASLFNASIDALLNSNISQHIPSISASLSSTHPFSLTTSINNSIVDIHASPFNSNDQIAFFILSIRPYSSSASTSVDNLIHLNIQNILLKQKLSNILIQSGINPLNHPLLQNIQEQLPHEQEHEESQDIPHEHLDHSPTPIDSLESDQQNLLKNTTPSSAIINLDSPADLSLLDPQSIPLDQNKHESQKPSSDNPEKKKKKRPLQTDDMFCRQCGITSSPEWRRGPDGPKTLCNACGLAFSKKKRKSLPSSSESKLPEDPSIHPSDSHDNLQKGSTKSTLKASTKLTSKASTKTSSKSSKVSLSISTTNPTTLQSSSSSPTPTSTSPVLQSLQPTQQEIIYPPHIQQQQQSIQPLPQSYPFIPIPQPIPHHLASQYMQYLVTTTQQPSSVGNPMHQTLMPSSNAFMQPYTYPYPVQQMGGVGNVQTVGTPYHPQMGIPMHMGIPVHPSQIPQMSQIGIHGVGQVVQAPQGSNLGGGQNGDHVDNDRMESPTKTMSSVSST